MLWHNGDVYDAVNKVKELHKYLFVSIRDTDTPKNYINILETSERLHDILKNSVCLNLLKDSDEYIQFSSVYEVEEIPSIYVITHQGELITIIKNVEEENIYNELKSVFGIQTEEPDLTMPHECLSVPASTDNTEQTVVEESISHEDKMAEVRRLLAEKHKQRAEEEKRKAIEDELKCREQGRQLNQLKRAQKEKEDQELKDELKRTRNAEKLARERILRQIEDDKLERKQRFPNQSTVKPPEEMIEDQQVIKRSIANNSGVRLLFRFPDGSSTNHKFNADDKFSVVRAFVAAYVQNNMGHRKPFEIRKFFPTETITAECDSSTLSDLNLVPSASFAVSFLASPKISNQSVSLMSWVLAPINFVLLTLSSIVQWITSRFTGAAPSTPAQNGASTYSTWEERQKRLAAAQSRTIKKDGNVAGFSDTPRKDDDDEDEARWNGNSTQQM